MKNKFPTKKSERIFFQCKKVKETIIKPFDNKNSYGLTNTEEKNQKNYQTF